MTNEPLEPRRLLASPEIDLTFGRGGIAGPPDYSGEFFAVNVLPDGKIVAAGSGNAPNVTPDSDLGSDDPFVARFNADGSLDTTFDGDGVLLIPLPSVVGTADAAVGPDGKIVLLHYLGRENEIRAFRFNADGTPDAAFGTDGVALLPVGNYQHIGATRIAVQDDGKVVFGFYGQISLGNTEFFLVRLNADGSVDNGFRGGLANKTPLGNYLSNIEVGPDGKIYGTSSRSATISGAPTQQAVVVRYNADGSRDTTYGDDGFAVVTDPFATSPIHTASGDLESIAFDAQGRVLVNADVANRRFDPPTENVFLTRLTTTGARDLSFGGGKGYVDIGSGSGVAAGPVLVGDGGKITGVFTRWDVGDFTLFRLNADGSFDTTFGDNGRLAPTRKMFRSTALEFDNAGNLLVGGGASYQHIALTRFVPDSTDVALGEGGHLFVNGGDGADTIALRREGSQLIVRRNGVDTSFPFGEVTRLDVLPSAGDDVITVPFALPSSIMGGDGNDSITVGDGDVTIAGGEGHDTIAAGAGDHDITLGGGDDRVTTGAGADTIRDGGGNDVITPGDGADSIDGSYGDDSITTAGGNDTIYTGTGDDTVHAGAGHDLVQGQDDSDFGTDYDGLTGNKLYFGGDGDDSLVGGAGRNSLFGGAGHDTILGNRNHDYIEGGSEDDEIYASDVHSWVPGSRGDTILGGDGHDSITGAPADDFLFGGGGDDTLFGRGGDDLLHGGEGNDTPNYDGPLDEHTAVLDATPAPVTVAGGLLTFNGTAGNDELSLWAEGANLVVWLNGVTQTFPLAGIDRIVLNGNAGHDLLKLHAQLPIAAVLIGGAGDDELIGGALGDTLLGGDGTDHLFGNGGDDHLDGGFGADVMRGGLGFDTVDYSSRLNRLIVGLDGFAGDDGEDGENDFAGPDLERIFGGTHDDRLGGGAADNHLLGGAGRDVLSGGDGSDQLFGGGADDTISGDGGDDALHGGAGNADALLGGTGHNAYLDFDASGVLRFHGTERADQVSIWEGEHRNLVVWLNGLTHELDPLSVIRIELNGYGGNDLLKLNPGLSITSVLRGGGGNDTLIGGFQRDTLLGGEGDDRLDGGQSGDTLHGNGGVDTLDYSKRKVRVVVGLDAFQDDGEVYQGGDRENDFAAPDVENVIGTRFSDRIGGSAAANALFGGDGNDTLGGGGGDDSLYGQAGDDKLHGDDGDDYLEGGAGHDALYGNGGADALFGLTGNDRLFADDDDVRDTVRGGTGTDTAETDNEDDVLAVESVG